VSAEPLREDVGLFKYEETLIDTQEVHRVKRKQHKEEPEKPSDESGRTIATVNQDDLEDTLIFAFLTSAVSNKGKRQKKKAGLNAHGEKPFNG
jgi:hypothetical protein